MVGTLRPVWPCVLTPISIPPLTRKQVAVLALLADGYSQVDAADELGIAPTTVRSHLYARHGILERLGAHTTVHAVAIMERCWPGWAA